MLVFWITTLPMLGFVLLVGMGVLLIRVGSRRINDHPHCKACRFDLSAHDFAVDRSLARVLAKPGSGESDRAVCPECGTRLTPMYSLEFGARGRNWTMVGPGLALAVLPYALFVATMFRGGGITSLVTRNAPESLIVRLGESGTDYRLFNELVRRVESGEISPGTLNGLAARSVIRASQPSRMTRFGGDGDPLITALLDAGAITSTDLIRLMGEPVVSIRTDPRTYRSWVPIVFVHVTFPTPNISKNSWITIENVAAFVTDTADRHGAMSHSQVALGSLRGGKLMSDTSVSYTRIDFSLLPVLVDARGVKVDLPTRDIVLQGDLVLWRNGVEIGRLASIAFDTTQDVLDPFDATIGLDMDPAINKEAHACYDAIWAAHWTGDANPASRLIIRWPWTDASNAHAYRMSVRPAGKPDAPPMLIASIPTPERQTINGRLHAVVVSPDRVDASISAVDIAFEPDPVAAGKRLEAMTIATIPGRAFTIQNVQVRSGPQPPSQP